VACSAFALRVTTWGVNIGRFLTAFLTANLSTIYGWRTVPKIYAAIVAIFAVPFHLLSADSPNAWAKRASPAMSESEQKLLGVDLSAPEEAAEEKAKPARKLSDYRFLVSIAGLCPTVIHTADNMTSYWCGTSPSPRASLRASLRLTAPRCRSLAYWAPTYFMEDFALSTTATGAYLGSTHLISMAGCVIAPLAEIAVKKMGASQRSMRRIIGGGGCVLQAACISGFVLMPTPTLAAAVYAANNLFKCFTNDGGYYTNCTLSNSAFRLASETTLNKMRAVPQTLRSAARTRAF